MTVLSRFWVMIGGLALLAGCQEPAPQPVQLGHVATLSGPDKRGGEQAMLGIRLAVEAHNKDLAQGLGRPVVVRHTDTQGKLAAFEAEAVRLASVNKVTALLGGSSTEEVARLDRARLPLLTPIGFRGRGQSEQVFCTGLSPGFISQVLARFANQDLKMRQVTVVGDTGSEEQSVALSAFSREFTRLTKEQEGESQITTLPSAKKIAAKEWAQRLAKEKPTVVLFVGAAAELAELLREWPEPSPILFAGPDDGELPGLTFPRPKAAIYWVTAFAADADLPHLQDFGKRFRAAFNQEADIRAALAYDNLRLLLEGFRRTQPPFSTERLVEELAKIKDFPGLTGTLSFNASRVLKRAAFVVRLDGKQAKMLKRYDPDE